MAIDDTKVQFSSQWEIDQRKKNGTLAVSSGTTLVTTVDRQYAVCEMMFQPTGSTKWFMPGVNSTNNTVAGAFTFTHYVNGNNLYVKVTTDGTIRYYVYTDKVNY